MANINELRTSENGTQELTMQVQTAPMEVTITNTGDGVILTLYPNDTVNVYKGNMPDRNFAAYKKEMKALFKDFDDILGEINRKYGLKIAKSR